MRDLTWLITGGAGSLGQELVQQILKISNPKAIRIFDNDEETVSLIRSEFPNPRLRFLIGDIRDKNRLQRAMNGVDMVIHCAALKHVDLCEYNPMEAVKTNILGSMNVIDCAIDNKVYKVIGISSDKASAPINLYGITKLAMERLFINASVYGETTFCCVRFGNFIASSGSVIPKMIEGEQRGEIQVTDINMTRYWITLQNASAFILKFLTKSQNGEIFIPKMEEMCLKDIIQKYAPTAKWKVIGKRPGEKLTELLYAEEEKEYIEELDDYFMIRKRM